MASGIPRMGDVEGLKTIEDAWGLFTTRLMDHVRAELHCPPRTEFAVADAAVADDAALAAFIRQNEGVFEERLIARASELMAPRWQDWAGDWDSALGLVLGMIINQGHGQPRRGSLDATLAAIEPSRGLELCRVMIWRHGDDGWERAVWFFAGRLDRSLLLHEVAPEMRDAIACPRFTISGAEVLPRDLDGLTPRDIEAIFEAYVGVPIAEIEARLRPGRVSDSGFLGPDDRLGEVVREDARRLRELGVDRHVLADRLQQAIERGLSGGGPHEVTIGDDHPVRLEVRKWGCLGYQNNPFHTLDMDLTKFDFMIVNPSLGPDLAIRGSALAPTLIRRFCFFEGRVRYRIDPERAARVLGLAR